MGPVPRELDSTGSPLALLLRVHLLQGWRRFKAIRSQSRLLTALITGFICGYFALAYWIFEYALRFLRMFPGLGSLLVERLMFLLFAFLMILLLFSNLVIGYSNLFRNRETSFLMSLPVSAQAIFRWKFIESMVLASWAFLFLIAPLLTAYGRVNGAPWHFYLVTVGLVALFIILPGIAGSWAAVNLARYLDRRRFQVLAVAGLIGFLAVAVSWWRVEAPVEAEEERAEQVLDRILVRTEFAQFPFAPSYWLSSGVLQWGEGAVRAAGFFSLVLLSHVLFFGMLAFTRMGGPFYEAFSALHSRDSVFGRWSWFPAFKKRRRREEGGAGFAERVFAWLPWVRSDVRAVLVKDARVFWRDTTQWGQTLVLFGLLGVYIINLRHFAEQLTNPFWINLVAYLNVGACALNLATLTTRFVYPQFSLEGKRLWIIGMAPLGLETVIRAKYWLAAVASLAVTVSLVWLSCHMLQIPAGRVVYFVAIIAVMTLTLNGLATGLGVLYPNFKEENPGKIVSGFGGTFCLVLSFLYIFGSVVVLGAGSPWGWGSVSWQRTALSWGVFGIASGLLWRVPMRLAMRRVREIEI